MGLKTRDDNLDRSDRIRSDIRSEWIGVFGFFSDIGSDLDFFFERILDIGLEEDFFRIWIGGGFFSNIRSVSVPKYSAPLRSETSETALI